MLSLMFVSCSNDHVPRYTSGGETINASGKIDPLIESCAIALTPHADAASIPPSSIDRTDAQIVRYQTEAQKLVRPVPHLEKLGWAFVAKARASSDPGFYTLAEQTALCIEAIEPPSPEALLLRGYVLYNRHEFKAAESLAKQLVSTRGHWFEYGLLGDALMEQGRLNESVDAYQNMMNQRPGPQAYSRAAHLRFLKGDLAGAIELMEMTVRSTSLRITESAAWARSQAALYRFHAGNFDRAASWLDGALHLEADYPPALLIQGRLLLAQEKMDQAVSSLSRAAQINPTPQYLWPLLEALRLVGRFDDADAVESKLRKHGPQDDPRTYALYLATYRQGIDTALQLTERELAAREDVFTMDARAWALRAAGQIPAALEFSRRALAEGTQDARLFYHAGVIAAAAGHREQAERLIDKANAKKHMLLPSEREHLDQEFAALQSQKPTPAGNDVLHNEPLHF